MLTRREVILAKVESTYNVDASPVGGTDAVLVEQAQWTHTGLRMIERVAVRDTLAPLKELYGGTLVEVTFDCELKGSGSAGTAPEIGTLLRGCALEETIVASTSVTYTPRSSGFESLTIYYYQDGTLHKFTGCRGTCTGTLEAGNKGRISFTFTGHLVSTTDVSLATPTYNGEVPPVLINLSSFSVGSYTPELTSLTFDLQNSVTQPADITASDGYGEIAITGRNVSGTLDPKFTTVATKDWLGILRASTNQAIDTGAIGSAGNQYTINFPAAYFRDATPGDRDGNRTLDIPFGATTSSGDDEISIAFT